MQAPDVEVGLVQAVRGTPAPRPGIWHGPFRYDSWVIDWCGHDGQSTLISAGATRLGPVARPARSWHVYALGTTYQHLDQRQVGTIDSLWFFFSLRTPWPLLASRPVAVIVDDQERLVPHLHAMFALQQEGSPDLALARHGHAQVVFGEILIASQRGGDGSPQHPWRIQPLARTGDSLLLAIDREVLRDLRRPPAIASLAERLRLAPSTLCHRFRAENGLSVMQRVRWLRMREARRLLAQPQASVKSVARALGFASPYHLSRMFRQLTGMTARDFIAQQRTG